MHLTFNKSKALLDYYEKRFVLQTHLEKSQSLKQPLYCCFVDFRKALDSISHTLLWRKLRIMGMSDLILSLLSDMYGKAKPLV